VAPATLHTINKIALGFADSVVTTTIASAWGQRLPIVFVPAMHQSLSHNPVLERNLAVLKQDPHLFFLEPKWEEGKAKFLDIETIVSFVSHRLHEKDKLSGKKIVITAGPTRGPIDPVRFISNYSSGELGVRLAQELYMRGANPVLVYGPGEVKPHDFYRVVKVKTPQEMQEAVISELRSEEVSAAIFSAAVLDHVPSEMARHKLSSSEPLQIDFKRTEKIIRVVDGALSDKKRFLKIGFKLEWQKTEDELKTIGMNALETMNVHAVVVNDLSQMGGQKHPGFILRRCRHPEARIAEGSHQTELGTASFTRVETKSDIINGIIQILEDDL
ncbi:MAG: phosphopantothenoylcysteine decarboxylase, partial [Deltaproteobacteria bacterium]